MQFQWFAIVNTVIALNYVPEHWHVKDCRSKKNTVSKLVSKSSFLFEDHQEQPMACHSRNLNCAGVLQQIESIKTVSPNTMELSLCPLFISFSWVNEITVSLPWDYFQSCPTLNSVLWQKPPSSWKWKITHLLFVWPDLVGLISTQPQ